ncbi:MAG: hypothetical protein AAB114_03435, partial [Chloroflexota bacterium]
MRRDPRGVFPRRIELAALVLPSVLLSALIAFHYFVIQRVLPPGWSHLALLGLAVAGVLAFSLAIFGRLTELQLQEREQSRRLGELAADLERRRSQLHTLNQAGMSLAAELDTSAVLQKIADLAREVANARYAALGIFDENGEVAQFMTSGISAEERARIGALPRGRGLLGRLQEEQRPIRVADLRRHPA